MGCSVSVIFLLIKKKKKKKPREKDLKSNVSCYIKRRRELKKWKMKKQKVIKEF